MSLCDVKDARLLAASVPQSELRIKPSSITETSSQTTHGLLS